MKRSFFLSLQIPALKYANSNKAEEFFFPIKKYQIKA